MIVEGLEEFPHEARRVDQREYPLASFGIGGGDFQCAACESGAGGHLLACAEQDFARFERAVATALGESVALFVAEHGAGGAIADGASGAGKTHRRCLARREFVENPVFLRDQAKHCIARGNDFLDRLAVDRAHGDQRIEVCERD